MKITIQSHDVESVLFDDYYKFNEYIIDNNIIDDVTHIAICHRMGISLGKNNKYTFIDDIQNIIINAEH